MRDTRRMKRMGRVEQRARRMPKFNLVSLMDIFTILVFFLLVNSSNTEQLPNTQSLKLPESVATEKPEETAVVMVTDTDILVQGRAVATIEEVMADESLTIPAVREELGRISERVIGISTKVIASKKEVTIMGDRKIPFKLLKKIMTSCTFAGYDTIFLAVIQKASQFKEE